jgi:hypothetical protein
VYGFLSVATDHVGHEEATPPAAQATIQFDRTAPVLVNIPANQVLSATSPAGAVATFTLPSATDGIDPAPTATCSRSSGSVFPIGTTTVTCTSTDDAGNTDSASFTITVLVVNGPQVSDVRLPGKGKTIRAAILTFDKELNGVEAERLENYEIRAPGKDKLFGTTDDKLIALRSAVYDAAANEVTLTPAKKLKVNRAFQITVQDTLTDLAGTPLDGDSDGIPGGDHAVRGGRWSHITYFDSDGDRVKIRLVNHAALPGVGDDRFDEDDPAGWMEVLWGPGIEGRRLLLTHTVPGQSVLLGSVKRAAGGDGVTALESVAGTSGVKNRLTNPPFVIGTIAAEIVDTLLETAALDTSPGF